MARILFIGLDGAEKSFQLQTHRPFTVGRDPGNDIVLRDPKISRHHAEIVFDRGFFVVHDLASANGTWVNGKKIRVAPLTHGAKMRMGNTFARFSEELPTEGDGDSDATKAAPERAPFDQPVPPTEDLGPLDLLPTSENPRAAFATVPHAEALAVDDVKKK
jgi:pSer/pThr/pTyr-binding forkhead associated (FHA) protein